MRARFALTASAKPASSAAFYVDKDLMHAFKPDDILYMARTCCGGLGVSLLRSDQLVFAVGAIGGIPLGNGVSGKTPLELVDEAESLFKRRDFGFGFPEHPLQFSVDGQVRLIFRGRMQLGSYEQWVEQHGFRPGDPGEDEGAAISLKGACGATAASATTQLLNTGDLEHTPEWWPIQSRSPLYPARRASRASPCWVSSQHCKQKIFSLGVWQTHAKDRLQFAQSW
jgi:hypothetical protein